MVQLYHRVSRLQARPVMIPSGVVPSVSGSDIVVDWNAVPTADSYNYYASIDGGDWTLLGNSATTSYSFTPTTPGEYNFRVTSVRGDKESAPSAETLCDGMMEQVYSDTIKGLRISAVDGTAFVDDVAALTGYADGNHLLEIEDSLGNVASGVLSAQGSGETLGSELVVNGDFETGDLTGWSVTGFLTPGASINASSPLTGSYDLKIENTDDTKSGGVETPISVSIGGLYKTLLKANLISGALLYRVVQTNGISGSSAGWAGNLLNTAVAGSYNITQYSTEAEVTTRYIVLGTYRKETLQYLDNVSAKQVLTPSTSGALIVSEIDGATQNFVSIPAEFTYNQPSYICRVKKILPTV